MPIELGGIVGDFDSGDPEIEQIGEIGFSEVKGMRSSRDQENSKRRRELNTAFFNVNVRLQNGSLDKQHILGDYDEDDS